MKPVRFVGSSLGDLKAFPREARKEAGFELDAVQRGFDPSDWRSMSTIGPGVREIRIHGERAFRIIYVAKFDEAVYVLHAFAKTTQKTAKKDIVLAKTRYQEVVQAHKARR